MKCINCNTNEALKYSKYSSGKFCSKYCANSFSTKEKRAEINKKVSEKLKGKIIGGKPNRTHVIPIAKICPQCKNTFYVFLKHKNKIYCSKKCVNDCPEHKLKMSIISSKRCSTPEGRERMKIIGRKGGFGTKGYTKLGIYYQSNFEKNAFEYLENNNIKFEPHKPIPNSSKISDVFLPKINLWIELDGIDREKRKMWLGKDYDYWIEKLQIYKNNNLNYIVFKSMFEFENYIKKTEFPQ